MAAPIQALLRVAADALVDDFAELPATHFAHGIHRSSHALPWDHRALRYSYDVEETTVPAVRERTAASKVLGHYDS